ncbi:hypothetical protein GRP75_00445 [Paenibacillus sp. OT2-17]|nr:hypothetical protein H6F38_06855 [Paenibacillus sp. EKM208P]MXO76340.1 hypothetical protein [Paenibacillus sp. OT2-17]
MPPLTIHLLINMCIWDRYIDRLDRFFRWIITLG